MRTGVRTAREIADQIVVRVLGVHAARIVDCTS